MGDDKPQRAFDWGVLARSQVVQACIWPKVAAKEAHSYWRRDIEHGPPESQEKWEKEFIKGFLFERVKIDVRDHFLRHLTKVVAGAVKSCQEAHGSVDPGSIGKRVAAHLWGETQPVAWSDAAQFMRHARGQLGLSQVELAALLGVAQRQISGWENGHHKPRRATLDAVSALLGTLRGSKADN